MNWRDPSPRTVDYALTALVLVASVTESLLLETITGPRWVNVALAVAMSVLLLWRRSHPVATAAMLTVLGMALSATVTDPSELVATFFPLLILAYSGGAYARGRSGLLVLAILIVAVCVVAVADNGGTASDIYFPATIVTLCWLGGRTVRLRLQRAAELHETAALAAEQREREAQAAVADERRRIAREMHDVVAHSISIMVVQAGGARRILASDPARAEQAAARIRHAGSDALAEMDVLLGVLGTDTEHARAPTLDRLEELVARTRDAGLPVTLAVSGKRRPLPLGAEQAMYRVVQEALTNAIKHAGSATTTVTLRWGEDTLELRVADRGDGGASPQLAGAGHGLIGMRERVRAVGGELEAGPCSGGGFEVVARVPLERATASVP
ncbi:MAG TPA: sensor histidine kinase [Solirubrobacteraceae bacterium]|nr:sensor histidine kinase [Solirubrobacteraceae bacterium]